ncbi:hypothetical protein DEO72_LG10g1645 [Vigna unguiculata]|uniref:Uncharacterized protein n=1 Tax=Vigna unguiculata TaxID=3917 RepID=A0A4D6NE13_VIGUN|nr:hypothetical protein DEO72_LG10g1645 [Vigna unguiculata]
MKTTLDGLDGVDSRMFLAEQRKERVLETDLTAGCVKTQNESSSSVYAWMRKSGVCRRINDPRAAGIGSWMQIIEGISEIRRFLPFPWMVQQLWTFSSIANAH